jgi:DNA polymerase-3 subunit delta
MKLTLPALDGQLARALPRAWLVSGDEPLLVNEAADAVRKRARAAGHAEREIHFAERGLDWADLRASASTRSLFGDRKIVEVRLPTGKPGAAGSAVLAELAGRDDPDTLLLVLSGRLDRDAQGAEWVRAIESRGAWLAVWPVDPPRLPEWLRARARTLGLTLEDGATALLAERTEGNLLAAAQELERIALTAPSTTITAATVEASVADSARFDVFQLGAAVVAADPGRALRVLEGLRAEGVEGTLVLWALLRELRAVWEARSGDSPRGAYRGGRATPGLEAAARRLPREAFRSLTERAARADRMLKGQQPGDGWDELMLLAAAFAGARTPRVR